MASMDKGCRMTFLQRLEELARLVGVWRSARCAWPAKQWDHDVACDGDLHLSACPVQRALDDVIAAHNALGAPGMR